MQKAKPTEIQYCLRSGELVEPGSCPYPSNLGTSFLECETYAQRLLDTYWYVEGGELHPKQKAAKSNPIPDLVRVLDEDGSVFCQWSVEDMIRRQAAIDRQK